MAPINEPPAPHRNGEAWNEAYDRLVNYLNTFALGDHAYVSQLAVNLLREAQDLHRSDSSRAPTSVTIALAQKRLADWLATNLEKENQSPSHILPIGTIALLLSQVYRTDPDSFLAHPLPEELRQALRETLLVTGPDLNYFKHDAARDRLWSDARPRPARPGTAGTCREIADCDCFFGLAIYFAFYWWLSAIL